MIAGVSRKPFTSPKKGGESSYITGAPGEKTDDKLEYSMETNEGIQQSQGRFKKLIERHMSRIKRKSGFGIDNHVQHKSGFSEISSL